MVSPIPRIRSSLSGRVRGRRQAVTGKIVVQVEEVLEHSNYFIPIPPPPWCTDRAAWIKDEQEQKEASWRPWKTVWRDATLQDLLSGAISIEARNNSTP